MPNSFPPFSFQLSVLKSIQAQNSQKLITCREAQNCVLKRAEASRTPKGKPKVEGHWEGSSLRCLFFFDSEGKGLPRTLLILFTKLLLIWIKKISMRCLLSLRRWNPPTYKLHDYAVLSYQLIRLKLLERGVTMYIMSLTYPHRSDPSSHLTQRITRQSSNTMLTYRHF